MKYESAQRTHCRRAGRTARYGFRRFGRSASACRRIVSLLPRAAIYILARAHFRYMAAFISLQLSNAIWRET